MADNKRDVTLEVAASTTGVESILDLAKTVRALGKDGAAAVPAFDELANQLDKLGAQAQAVSEVSALADEVQALAAAQAAAGAATKQVGEALTQTKATTEQFRAAEDQVRAAVDQARLSVANKRKELADLNTEYVGAARRSDEYRNKQAALKAAIAGAVVEVKEKEVALRRAQEATQAAVQGEKTLAQQAAQTARAEAQTAKALEDRQAALDKAAAAMRQSGVESADLAQAQQALLTTFAALREEVDKQAAAQEKAARTAKDLALAQRLLDTELEISTASKREAIRLEQQQIAASEAATRALREQAAAAQAALQQAFGRVGVRSAQTIQGEINEINAALARLASDATVTGADFDRAFRAAQERIQALQREMSGLPAVMERSSAAANLLRSTVAQVGAAFGAVEIGRAFIDANVQIEMLRRSMTLITGSTSAAAAEIEFLQQTANKAGMSVGQIADAFVRFSASASTAGIPLQTVRDTFEATVMAAGQMGLSSDKAALALDALAQMASKGVVSMEELRGQLGDSLPGALSIAAKGLGVSTSELVKMVETGQVLTEDFLPAFARSLRETFGNTEQQTTGLLQAWNRLKNAITETAQQAADTAPYKLLVSAMDALAGNFDKVVTGATALGKAWVALKAISIVKDFLGVSEAADKAAASKARATAAAQANAVAEAENAAATRTATVAKTQQAVATTESTAALASNTAALGANAAAAGASAAATRGAGAAAGAAAGGASLFGRALGALGGPWGMALGVAVASRKEIGTWVGETAAKLMGWGKVMADAEAKIRATDKALADINARAQENRASWLQLAATYARAAEQSQQNVVVATKLADAKKREGETAVQLAELSGDEIRVRAAAAFAATNYEQAVRTASAARQKDMELLVAQRAALIEAAGGEAKLSEEKRKAIADIDASIKAKQAEVEQARQVVEAAAQESAARRVAAQTMLDNAGALTEFKAAAEAARQSYDLLVEAERQGFATKEGVAQAARRAAEAEALYADALGDTVRAIDRKVEAIRRNASLSEAGLRVDKERARTMEQEAELYGNTAQAAEARLQQKRLEIETTRSGNQALLDEAKALREGAEAARREAEATGTLTPQKQAEIDSRLANARAKELEAQRGAETIKQLDLEVQAIQRRNTASASGINSRPADPRVGSDTATSKVTYDQNDGLAALQQKSANKTLGAGDLALAKAVLSAALNNQQLAAGNPFAFSREGRQSVDAWAGEAQRLYDEVNSIAKREQAANATSQGPDPNQPNTTGVRTVNVVIGGKGTAITTASSDDADRLVGMLRSLEGAANRASNT